MTEETIKTASLSKLELLQIAIAIIVFSSPLLYLIGIAFYQGFLSAYGINISFFPPTLFEIYGNVYIFFIGIYFSIIKLLWYIIPLVVFIFMIVLIFLAYSKCYPSPPLKKTNAFFRPNSFLKEFLQHIWSILKESSAKLKIIFIFPIYILLPPILFALCVYSADKKGKEYSNTEKKDYLENGCYFKEKSMWSNCDSLVNKKGEILHTGLLIASTNNYIAFFNCEGSIVTKFPNDAVIINEIKKIDGKGKKKSNNPFPYCQNVPVTSTSKTQ
ncbi:MAG: hypothetical protein V3U92_05715 [Cellulophaga sp.]